MDAQYKNNFVSKLLIISAGLGMSFNLFAEAGVSLFTYGKVQLRSVNGQVVDLNRNMSFDSGDTVITGINGRAQLKMKDGAIFDLKPSTEFVIESYNFDVNSNKLVNSAAKNENKGFYKLIRGGFRSISGLIGKRNKKNYRVTTPVATIGIRGTDYTANLCEFDCGTNGVGLYLSVAEGGVVLANDAGSMDYDLGQSGFVANAQSAPVSISGSAVPVTADSAIDDPINEREATDENGNMLSLENGDELPEPTTPPLPPSGVSGSYVAIVAGNLSGASGVEANLELGENNQLEGFTDNQNVYRNNTTSVNNQGFDSSTGLYWGRWSNGSATVNNSETVALNDSSAHWVYQATEVATVLPSTGEASFRLIGNTNPTDNAGNSGVLGSANLSADFTNQTVDAEVNLNIENRTWEADAEGVALNGEAATFAGDFDSVEITDNATGRETQGTGSLEGFFSGDADGQLGGAGLAYNLEDAEGVEVEGSLAFEVDEIKDGGKK